MLADDDSRSDKEILANISDTSTHNAAIHVLFARHHKNLVARCARQLKGDWDNAEEIVQRMWIKADRNLPRYDPELSSVLTWLCCIKDRLILDHFAARKQAATVELMDTIPGEESDASAPIEGGEIIQTLQLVPPKFREAMIAVYLHGQTMTKIAHDNGVPLTTVQYRVQRGVAILRKLYLSVPKAPRLYKPDPCLSDREIQMMVA